MDKIPNVDYFLQKYMKYDDYIDYEELKNLFIEFCKLHVQQALKKASEENEIVWIDIYTPEVDKDSILNAYPLENIK